MMRFATRALLLAALSGTGLAAPPVPLPADHPVIGTWAFTVPGTGCTETYHINADGTSLVTSGGEVGESVFEISVRPSRKGFYKWFDRVTQDNGAKDCQGERTKVGQEATNFILVRPDGQMLVVCRDESLDACFGPLERLKDGAI